MIVQQSLRPTTVAKYRRDLAQIKREMGAWHLLGASGRITAKAWNTYLTLKVLRDDVSASRLDDLQSAVAHLYLASGTAGDPTQTRESRSVLRAFKRSQRRRKPARQSRCITRHELRLVFRSLRSGANLSGVQLRNRAIVLLACATGLRPRALVNLARCDVVEQADGLAVRVAESKTSDQVEWKFIARREDGGAFCWVSALRIYLDKLPTPADSTAPLFFRYAGKRRTDKGISVATVREAMRAVATEEGYGWQARDGRTAMAGNCGRRLLASLSNANGAERGDIGALGSWSAGSSSLPRYIDVVEEEEQRAGWERHRRWMQV